LKSVPLISSNNEVKRSEQQDVEMQEMIFSNAEDFDLEYVSWNNEIEVVFESCFEPLNHVSHSFVTLNSMV
jgi:hypothetical protein